MDCLFRKRHAPGLWMWILLAWMVVLSNCAVHKSRTEGREDSVERKVTAVGSRLSADSLSEQKHILIENDSTGEEYLTEIEPLGLFQYSTGEGFKGSASRIVIRGRASRRTSLSDMQATLLRKHAEVEGSTVEEQTAEKSRTSEETEKEPAPSWVGWWLTVAIGGITGGAFYYWRYIRRKI